MRALNCFKQVVSGLFLVGVMASCNKEKPVNENLEANFQGSIGSLVKVSGSDGNVWDAGDAIGIYMKNAGTALSSSTIVNGASNRKYATLTGSSVFTSQNGGIRFPETGNVDFISYYPYGNVNGDFKMNVDVANQASQKDLIVMYSNNAISQSADNPNVGLYFKHVMSKFVLNIGSNAVSLSGLKVEFVGVNTQSVFSVTDGSLTDDPSSKGSVVALTAANGATAVSEAVLLPANNLTDAKIKFTVGGNDFFWDMPGMNYEAAKKYTYTFNLKEDDGGLVLVNISAAIEGWTGVDGGSHDIIVDNNNPGGRQVILDERFGSLRSDNGTFAAAGYTGNTTFNNFNHFDFYPNPFTYTVSGTDVRVTTLVFAHFWIPATTGSYFEVSGLPANMTDITLSFDMVAGTANREANILQIVCDGNTLSPTNSDMDAHVFPTNTATSLKGFEVSIPNGTTTIRLYNSSFGAAAETTNSAWRVGNIKIEAVK